MFRYGASLFGVMGFLGDFFLARASLPFPEYFPGVGGPTVGIQQHQHSSSLLEPPTVPSPVPHSDLRGLWLYKLESRVGTNYRLKCLAWTGRQQEPQTWSQDLPACPCSLQQGQQDPRFRSSRGGKWHRHPQHVPCAPTVSPTGVPRAPSELIASLLQAGGLLVSPCCTPPHPTRTALVFAACMMVGGSWWRDGRRDTGGHPGRRPHIAVSTDTEAQGGSIPVPTHLWTQCGWSRSPPLPSP